MSNGKTVGWGDYAFNTFFNETRARKHVPYTLFLDLDPTVIENTRTRTYRKFFHLGHFICAKEDATKNFI